MPRNTAPAAPHPPQDRLRAFALGELDRAEGKEVAAHLLRCRACLAAAVPLAQPLFNPDPVDPAKYDFPIARFRAGLRREIDRQRRARAAAAPPRPSAAALLDALRPRGLRLGERAWRRCERSLASSWKARHDDPEAMLQDAGAARIAAERIDPATRGPRALADLQARALAALGNARRVGDDPHGAELDLHDALGRCEAGTGDPLVLAEVLERLGVVYIEQRRFTEAREVLASAFRLYEREGKRHEAGVVLVHLGLAAMYDPAPREAAGHFLAALPLVDAKLEPTALPFCLHNLAWTWADCGRFEEARDLVWQSRGLFAALPDPLIQVKRLWLDGRIAAGLGHPGRAERCFLEVRKAFLARKLPYTAAVAALDLAILWLERGRTAQARALVAETLETFGLLGIAREALMAVALLSHALSQDCLTVAILQSAAADLQKIER
ncbi:MAG TPA: tetratricopeptide repeat protein [Thermoanaerobaculia bacterium]|nr:tetratricopeptide repeat protein [Thermoanaerobaculia bacterium]